VRILFLTSAHNSLSQRAQIELWDRGHEVSVELALGEREMLEAVERYRPELIIAPMLKKAVPEAIWRAHTCIIVHPGIVGDRGPSSLDWAILEGETEWGVTCLQAAAEMDAGDIWASRTFPMRAASKSSLYKNEVVDAAIAGLLETVERFASGTFRPTPLEYGQPHVRGRLRPVMKQEHRVIDWSAPTAEITRRIRAADGSPGVLGRLAGQECFLFGAHEEDALRGAPGQIVARRDGAICLGTGDGALWITHLKRRNAGDRTYCKLPAAMVLGDDALAGVPEVPLAPHAPHAGRTFREIEYTETDGVGTLRFDFYNGAMSTEQCERLRQAFVAARRRTTRVIVLESGPDAFSNGIHLNVIEAAPDPAAESWRNINAIDDLILEILATETHLVVAAMAGNAGAGGVILALAADRVWARDGVVLNPHYKGMGGLYGSEYWTYLLPRRVGAERAGELTESLLPIGTRAARRAGLIDDAFGVAGADFTREVTARAAQLATHPELDDMLAVKRARRASDEAAKPLAAYRAEELARMHENFFGQDDGYHRARRAFVFKQPATATPTHLALHRA